jgi:hypothetical protein
MNSSRRPRSGVTHITYFGRGQRHTTTAAAVETRGLRRVRPGFIHAAPMTENVLTRVSKQNQNHSLIRNLIHEKEMRFTFDLL